MVEYWQLKLIILENCADLHLNGKIINHLNYLIIVRLCLRIFKKMYNNSQSFKLILKNINTNNLLMTFRLSFQIAWQNNPKVKKVQQILNEYLHKINYYSHNRRLVNNSNEL